MSLDVYLTLEGADKKKTGSGIFVRENGQTKEISRAEWDNKNPGREPIIYISNKDEGSEVYHANITHNLNQMASKAGIYLYLWRPEEIKVTRAEQLIEPLQEGLQELLKYPEKLKPFASPNGWGNYDDLVEFVSNYLKACKEYPQAEVSVSR